MAPNVEPLAPNSEKGELEVTQIHLSLFLSVNSLIALGVGSEFFYIHCINARPISLSAFDFPRTKIQ